MLSTKFHQELTKIVIYTMKNCYEKLDATLVTLRTDSRLFASVLYDLSYTSNGLLGFLNGPIRILDIQFITYRTPGAATDASTVPFSIFEVAARLPFSS